MRILSGSCPEVVRILSGSCPGGGQNKYETLGWSKLDLYSTPDNFKTSYGHSFLRSIDWRWSQGLVCYQNHVFLIKHWQIYLKNVNVKTNGFFSARSAPLTYVLEGQKKWIFLRAKRAANVCTGRSFFIVKYGEAKSKLVRMRAIRSLTIFLSRTNKQTRSQITFV